MKKLKRNNIFFCYDRKGRSKNGRIKERRSKYSSKEIVSVDG